MPMNQHEPSSRTARRRGRAVGLLTAALLMLGCSGEPRTPQPTPRPTVIVVTASGPYYEPFDDAGDWLVGSGTRSEGLVSGGEFLLKVTEPGYWAWTHQTRAFGEGVYEVTARLVSGPEASAFGLLLLGASDLQSFFYAIISGDGRYDVGYCEAGCAVQESLTGGYQPSAMIVPNAANRLRVDLQDGELAFSVNGTEISRVAGLEYTDGLAGLIGEAAVYGGFEAAFDDLQVTEEQFMP